MAPPWSCSSACFARSPAPFPGLGSAWCPPGSVGSLPSSPLGRFAASTAPAGANRPRLSAPATVPRSNLRRSNRRRINVPASAEARSRTSCSIALPPVVVLSRLARAPRPPAVPLSTRWFRFGYVATNNPFDNQTIHRIVHTLLLCQHLRLYKYLGLPQS